MVAFMSCNNDLDLTEDGTDVAVIYGAFNPSDSAQYIRVERAFIDDATSAYTLAKDIDQLYFKDIVVELEIDGAKHILEKVDGNEEGYIRSAGAFADAPNYLYKIKTSELGLNNSKKQAVKLTVKKADGSTLTEANATTLFPLAINDVNPPLAGSLLSLPYTANFRVTWYPEEKMPISDVNMIVHFDEISASGTVSKQVTWPIKKNITQANITGASYSYTANILGRSFYEFMRSNLTADPSINRVFKKMNLQIISADDQLRQYIQIGLANQGITSSGEIPTYSNLSNGGRGIFFTMTEFYSADHGLTKPTLDSLSKGIFTRALNFQ